MKIYIYIYARHNRLRAHASRNVRESGKECERKKGLRVEERKTCEGGCSCARERGKKGRADKEEKLTNERR